MYRMNSSAMGNLTGLKNVSSNPRIFASRSIFSCSSAGGCVRHQAGDGQQVTQDAHEENPVLSRLLGASTCRHGPLWGCISIVASQEDLRIMAMRTCLD